MSNPAGLPSSAVARSVEPALAGISPARALSSAFDDALRLLFAPFDARRWLRLTLVCLFLGGGTPWAAFHWVLGSLPGEVTSGAAVEQLREYIAAHPWVVPLATALGLALGLVLLYLRALSRFVLVDSILKGTTDIRVAWRELRSLGHSYFFWLLGTLVAVGTCLAVAALAALPYLRTAHVTGIRWLIFSLAVAGFLSVVLLGGLSLAVAITLTDDLAVPLMYAERVPLLRAWRLLWNKMRKEPAAFALYLALRFVVSVAVGLGVLIILFPVLLGFFSGAIIAGAMVILGLRLMGLAWLWNPLTMLLTAGALLLLSALLLVLLSVVGMPGQVFLQDFGISFMAPRVPSLDFIRRRLAPSSRWR